MRSDLERIRWRLRQNPWVLRTGWILVVLGAIQVTFTTVIAVVDDQQSAASKTANVAIGLWVFALGCVVVLFIRPGRAQVGVDPPEPQKATAKQLATVRRIFAGFCAGCLLVAFVLVVLALIIGLVVLVVGASFGVAGAVMGYRLRRLSLGTRQDNRSR